MGSIERRQRQAKAARDGILDAALLIAKNEGWQALSMRKIAEQIEYSATMIYEYFDGKEALLIELTRLGFLKLAKAMKETGRKFVDPKEKLVKMWLAYWDFAFAEREIYQLMFGIGTPCHTYAINTWGEERITGIVTPVINEVLQVDADNSGFVAECKYYAYWSAVHGLISLNLLNRGSSDEVNRHVLLDTMHGITATQSQ